MNVGQATIDLIKSFEGLETKAYQDVAGVWTIGYGHTDGVQRGDKITEDEAEELLRQDIALFAAGVKELVPDNLPPNQFGALVSFAYNVGLSALRKSTLLREVNEGNHVKAAAEFYRWTLAGGERRLGLLRRRRAESEFYLPTDYLD